MYARFHDNAGLTSRHILSYLPVTIEDTMAESLHRQLGNCQLADRCTGLTELAVEKFFPGP